MKYIFGLLLSLTFSDFIVAGDFGEAFAEIGSIIAEAAFDPIIRAVGGDLGKLTQEQIDELAKKGIDVWPPGATSAEIDELKKEGYTPQLNWSSPGTQYAYDRDGWIEDWRASKSIKMAPSDISTNSSVYFGDLGNNFKINQFISPAQAGEKLRQYTNGVIQSGEQMYLLYTKCEVYTCLDKAKDYGTLRALWRNITQLRPTVAWLRSIVMRGDPKVYKAYALAFDIDNLIKSPNDNPYEATLNIQRYHNSHKQQVLNFLSESPPKIG